MPITPMNQAELVLGLYSMRAASATFAAGSGACGVTTRAIAVVTICWI